MEQLPDNFEGFWEKLWNALFPEYTIDEFINDLSEIDNEDEFNYIIKDIKWILKDEIDSR